jgi:hypothetical protein
MRRANSGFEKSLGPDVSFSGAESRLIQKSWLCGKRQGIASFNCAHSDQLRPFRGFATMRNRQE